MHRERLCYTLNEKNNIDLPWRFSFGKVARGIVSVLVSLRSKRFRVKLIHDKCQGEAPVSVGLTEQRLRNDFTKQQKIGAKLL